MGQILSRVTDSQNLNNLLNNWHIMGVFEEFSWIQIYWMAQNALMLPPIILMKMGQAPVDKSAGEPCLGSQSSNMKFWQFRKR